VWALVFGRPFMTETEASKTASSAESVGG